MVTESEKNAILSLSFVYGIDLFQQISDQDDHVCELDLCGINLTEIPDQIKTFTHLKALYLDNNQITEIPPFLYHFEDLQSLSLIHNQISQISEELANLTHLRNIFLNSNQIEEFPIALSKMIQLRSIRIDENRIRSIPISFECQRNLTHFDISENPINNDLIDHFPMFSHLNSIGLSGLHLMNFPKFDGSQLEVVNLSRNDLTEFPTNLIHCDRIQELNLSHNSLSDIPSHCLLNLRELDLSDNLFTEIPLAMQYLQYLTQIKLKGNPIPQKDLELTNDVRNLQDSLAEPAVISELYEKIQDDIPLNFNEIYFTRYDKFKDVLLLACNKYSTKTAQDVRHLLEGKRKLRLNKFEIQL